MSGTTLNNTDAHGGSMDDLTATRLCAEAMGYKGWRSKHGYWYVTLPDGGKDEVCCEHWAAYDPSTGEKLREPTFDDALIEVGYMPLTDDTQCMALVKRFNLRIGTYSDENPSDAGTTGWRVWLPFKVDAEIVDPDLNRAVVYCVAAMQAAKERG